MVKTLLQRLFETLEDDTLPDNTRKHNQYKKMILQTNESLQLLGELYSNLMRYLSEGRALIIYKAKNLTLIKLACEQLIFLAIINARCGEQSSF